MNNRKKDTPPLWLRDIVSGGITGAIAASIGYPLVVMKKRSQMGIASFNYLSSIVACLLLH